MRIEKLYYRNHVTGWELATMEFGDVNLLVGVSGVGKTKILEAIRSLQKIAFGSRWNDNRFFNGIEWDITFNTSSDFSCRWHGKFNIIDNDSHAIDELNEKTYSQIESKLEVEYLYVNEEPVANRNDGVITFQGKTMPKLSPTESLITIFRSEDKITPIINGLLLIIDSQVQQQERWLVSLSSRKTEDLSLEDISKKNNTLVDKLGLLSINYPEIFNKIKLGFISVFPHVEELRMSKSHARLLANEDELSIFFTLEVKERSVDKWITQSNLSTGMLKTLAHIVEIYLLAEGSILLIDEFENSLGVNCIDVVTELLNDRKDIQFIITSHHPYIINKIPMQYWKIITRKGSIVTATDASDYEELSGSRHKVFTQLINLPDYTEGIQVG
jgi:predicted ATP-dependent endonuclease of OLD family